LSACAAPQTKWQRFDADTFGYGSTGLQVAFDGDWALLDRDGRVVLRPLAFDNGPDPFSEGLARFREDGKVGFFDERGRVVLPARFDWAEPFKGGRARVCRGCREVRRGEHAAVEGGAWSTVDRAGREAG
jgi:hypothetical protein